MITFSVPGPVRGKGRPRFARRGAHVVTYTDDKTLSYEGEIKHYASLAKRGSAYSGALIDGPVRLFVWVTKTVPKSWPKKQRELAEAGRAWPTGKPDADNILKTVCDALNGVIWTDDAQVVRCELHKDYGRTDGLTVIIEPIE